MASSPVTLRDNSARQWVLVAAILGSSMAFIDGTVVNVALPAMQTSLHADARGVQWVIEAYALMTAALTLVGGSLGDRFGRMRIFLAGVVLFAAASCWCGLAGSIGMLIAARTAQGIGQALMVPGSLAMISAAFPEEERGKAIGTWSGFSAMAGVVGPVLGGVLVQYASWRWIFFLNVPLAVVVLAIAAWRLPSIRVQHRATPLDWPGAALATAGLGLLTFALIAAQGGGTRPLLIGVGGLALLAAFLVVEARTTAPMLPLQLFRSRNFTGANVLTLLLYGALGGSLFFLPLELIQVRGYTPTEAGAALLPLILLLSVLSRWSGGLVARFGARGPLTAGPLVAAVGFALLSRAAGGGNYWTTIFPAAVVLGLGMTICVAPLTTTVMNAAPVDQAGVASGINNAVAGTGSLLAVAAFGLLLTGIFNHSVTHHLDALALPSPARSAADAQRPKLAAATSIDPQVSLAFHAAFSSGFRGVMSGAAVLAALSGVSAFLLLRPLGEPRKTESL